MRSCWSGRATTPRRSSSCWRRSTSGSARCRRWVGLSAPHRTRTPNARAQAGAHARARKEARARLRMHSARAARAAGLPQLGQQEDSGDERGGQRGRRPAPVPRRRPCPRPPPSRGAARGAHTGRRTAVAEWADRGPVRPLRCRRCGRPTTRSIRRAGSPIARPWPQPNSPALATAQ